MKHTKSLLNFIHSLQSSGQYCFNRADAINKLKITQTAFKMSAYRLTKKKQIQGIGKNFYIIIPPEYHKTGSLPPYWYVDQFMTHMNRKYYVALLTAAAYYGASHQASQQFQVILDKHLAMGSEKHDRYLVFITKKNIISTPVKKVKVNTGYINMSTREATALDLVQYYKLAGYWGLIGTVLLELSGDLSSILLRDAAKQGQYEIATIQRLGYLLDLLGFQDKTQDLYQLLQEKWYEKKRKIFCRLTPEKPREQNNKKDCKWRIIINDIVETDEI